MLKKPYIQDNNSNQPILTSAY